MHLSPRMAFVFSLISTNVPKFSMSHSSIPFLLVQFTFSHHVRSALVYLATAAALCAFFLLHPTSDIPPSFSGRSSPPAQRRSFRVFAYRVRHKTTHPDDDIFRIQNKIHRVLYSVWGVVYSCSPSDKVQAAGAMKGCVMNQGV